MGGVGCNWREQYVKSGAGAEVLAQSKQNVQTCLAAECQLAPATCHLPDKFLPLPRVRDRASLSVGAARIKLLYMLRGTCRLAAASLSVGAARI